MALKLLKSIKFTLKNLAGISKTKMNLLGRKPQRLQFLLTIKLALFFISISVIIHLYLTNKFEDEAMEIFQYKSKVITSYLEQVPQPLFLTDIKRTRVQELMTSFLLSKNHLKYPVSSPFSDQFCRGDFNDADLNEVEKQSV